MNTIKQEWELYKATVVPSGASPIQVQETRRAFYAGNEAMTRLMNAAAEKSTSEEDGMKALQDMGRELLDFALQVKAGEA